MKEREYDNLTLEKLESTLIDIFTNPPPENRSIILITWSEDIIKFFDNMMKEEAKKFSKIVEDV